MLMRNTTSDHGSAPGSVKFWFQYGNFCTFVLRCLFNGFLLAIDFYSQVDTLVFLIIGGGYFPKMVFFGVRFGF